MSRKHDLQFGKAERTYRINLLRILRKIFLISPPGRRSIGNIDIAAQLRRPATRQKILDITAPIMDLGTEHANELIEQAHEKYIGASAGAGYMAAAEPSNKYILDQLTEYTIDSMAFIADDIKPDLVTSLKEGYAQGESIPVLSKRVHDTWDVNRVRAVRFARTFTNEVYNQAHYNRYQDSNVVTGVQFSAHLDSRTSEQCRMLNLTIWALNDPSIQRPPLHFFCRSRIIPYLGHIPGKRDFRHATDGTEYSTKQVKKIQGHINTFKNKYWKIPIREVPKPYPE
ncbi:MAG: minor capsid protein [ANME-2 cluster archaeon]|nr:minor capsid protein [ANME-2 cluster archaeon]